MLAALLFACSPPPSCDCEALNAKIAELEAQLAPAKDRAPLPPISKEDEEAAVSLAKEAQLAADAGDFVTAQGLAAKLAADHPSSRAAKALAARTAGWLTVGATAPPPPTRWIRGDDAALAGKRAIIYVSFEVSCPLCKPELANLEKLRASHGARGLEVVALSRSVRSDSKGFLESMMKESGFQGLAAFDPAGAIAGALKLAPPPMAAVVVDGRVAWWGPPAKLDAARLDGWLAP